MKVKKIKVLHVGPGRKSRGGIASVINSYLSSVLAEKVIFFRMETQYDKNTVTKLLSFIKSVLISPYYFYRSDIIHIHVASYNSFYRKSIFIVLGKLINRKLVLHIHGGGFRDFINTGSQSKQKVIEWLLRLADCIICLSPLKRNEIIEHVDPKKVVIINNPCVFQAVGVIARQNINKIILFTGWIEKEKGVFDLIEAFVKVQKDHPDSELIIAGKGRIKDAEKLIKKYELTDKVVFTGWLEKNAIRELLQKADIFCLPSYCEGVPMSIIEAMVFSLPVIATPVGGIPDLITHKKTGFLVQPGKIEELAYTLSTLMQDDPLRLRIGKNAKAFIDEHCNIEVVINQLNSLYRSICSQSFPKI